MPTYLQSVIEFSAILNIQIFKLTPIFSNETDNYFIHELGQNNCTKNT